MRGRFSGARCEWVSFTSDFTKRDRLIIEISGIESRTVDRRYVGDLWAETGKRRQREQSHAGCTYEFVLRIKSRPL